MEQGKPEEIVDRIEAILEQPNSSFELAKTWSDYLAFHIRFLVFASLTTICFDQFIERRDNFAEMSWIESFTTLSLPAVGLLFLAFALIMLIRINDLNIDFLFARLTRMMVDRMVNERKLYKSIVYVSTILSMVVLVVIGLTTGLVLAELASLEEN